MKTMKPLYPAKRLEELSQMLTGVAAMQPRPSIGDEFITTDEADRLNAKYADWLVTRGGRVPPPEWMQKDAMDGRR